MAFNKIKYVGPRVLKDNFNLWHVDLSYNKIKFIASDLFRPTSRSPLSRVRRLNIAGNELERISPKLIKPLELLQGDSSKTELSRFFLSVDQF